MQEKKWILQMLRQGSLFNDPLKGVFAKMKGGIRLMR